MPAAWALPEDFKARALQTLNKKCCGHKVLVLLAVTNFKIRENAYFRRKIFLQNPKVAEFVAVNDSERGEVRNEVGLKQHYLDFWRARTEFKASFQAEYLKIYL